MDKAYYIARGQKQVSNAQFYKPTDVDSAGEVIQRVNLHAHGMKQRSQISQTCCYHSTDIDITQ